MIPVVISILFAHVAHGASPSVLTNQGRYFGKTQTFSSPFLTITEDVDVFLGIPYAKPPVGERRFRLPEPVDPSEESYNATKIPPSCPQDVLPVIEHLVSGTRFSEDCLYLNVFVPRSLTPNASVMVYIHGGGFASGSGLDIPFNPLPLAAVGKVIVVTINYRLNIFGFVSTGDDSIPPNIGITDQQNALKWVNENIASFGGDSTKVTIFGQSAGAACCGWHVLSPDSRRYFRRAILQSGNPLAFWAPFISAEEAFQKAERIAVLAGYELAMDKETELIADFFNLKSTEELVEIARNATAVFPAGTLWSAVIDGDFFENDIPSLLEEGSFKDVDILTGTTENEGVWISFFVSNVSREKPFISKTVFTELTVGMDDPLITGLLEAIYSDGIDGEGNYVDALSEVLGDVWFTCSGIEFAVRAASAGSKVFSYLLTHEPARSLWNFNWAKATHFDDTQFVFGLPFQGNPLYPPQYEELKISFYVMRMWTNFAKSGDPNVPVRLPSSITEWPQFIPGIEEYKELDISFANKRKWRQHQCNFLEKLLQQIIALQN